MPRLCPRHGARQDRAPGAMLGRRASRLAPPLPTRITRAHYPGGAMGTSRPTAITPAIFAPPLPPRITPPVRPAPYPVVRSRCGRARCPHRAAAPSARCAAWHPAKFARAGTRQYSNAIIARRHYPRRITRAAPRPRRCRKNKKPPRIRDGFCANSMVARLA